MKVIEGLKKIKDLQRKASDLRNKVAQCSAYLDYETPLYADQKKQVSDWLQAHSDILKEISDLRIAITKTNVAISVTIELGGKQVTKSIAEWVYRRRDLSGLERDAWKMLTDKNLREGTVMQSTNEKKEVKIVRCYDPKERDTKIELYTSEPSTIDSRLEVVNAITDLIGYETVV